MDKKVEKTEYEALAEAFDLKETEIFEAKYNLLGFYGTLQKIKWRLEKEGKI
ncbi:MAG TPA: hypothetical protein VJB41_03110 [Patescibacteria group bacterium]|nr:hypothetical protein [Patescibacteria group bacterium]